MRKGAFRAARCDRRRFPMCRKRRTRKRCLRSARHSKTASARVPFGRTGAHGSTLTRKAASCLRAISCGFSVLTTIPVSKALATSCNNPSWAAPLASLAQSPIGAQDHREPLVKTVPSFAPAQVQIVSSAHRVRAEPVSTTQVGCQTLNRRTQNGFDQWFLPVVRRLAESEKGG